MINAIEEFQKLPEDVQQKLIQIAHEFNRACEKHPQWCGSTDIIHGAAVVAEESGELVRAALMAIYEDGSIAEMQKEAVQTGAMALRFLLCR